MSTSTEFIDFAVTAGALRFGEFTTKAGRLSPYFFNAGTFDDGMKLQRLAQFYARTLQERIAGGLQVDMLFGPAYKGITLAATTACELARLGHNLPFCFNRKEAKDHGEGGSLVGAPLRGRVVIIDDVISAGTAVGESISLIRANGAEPVAVLISLDRQEKAGTASAPLPLSAVQNVQRQFGVPVIAIANLHSLLTFLESTGNLDAAKHRAAVQAYRSQYGVD